MEDPKKNYPTAPPAYYDEPPTQTSNFSQNNQNFGQSYPTSYVPPPQPPKPYNIDLETGVNAGYNDPETYDAAPNSNAFFINFEQQDTRKRFIAKIYFILGIQLLITFVPVVLVSVINREASVEWVKNNPSTVTTLFWVSFAVTMVIAFGLSCCCTSLARKTPWNYLILLAFTLAEAFLVTMITLAYDTKIVLITLGVTAIVVLVVSVFSAFTKFDFTKWIHIMGVVLLIWISMSWMFAIGWFGASNVAYGLLGATIFTIYLAIDTQLVIGGKKYEIDEEDYVFACLILYLDIINIFLYLLALFGGND